MIAGHYFQPHPPQPIPYVCGGCWYDYVTNTTAWSTDTTYSHTLPNRFARRPRRLAHPSHALASPPPACSRGARHPAVCPYCALDQFELFASRGWV